MEQLWGRVKGGSYLTAYLLVLSQKTEQSLSKALFSLRTLKPIPQLPVTASCDI